MPAASPIPIASIPSYAVPSPIASAWRIEVRQICPSCQGVGCERCRLSGWLTADTTLPSTMPIASVRLLP